MGLPFSRFPPARRCQKAEPETGRSRGEGYDIGIPVTHKGGRKLPEQVADEQDRSVQQPVSGGNARPVRSPFPCSRGADGKRRRIGCRAHSAGEDPKLFHAAQPQEPVLHPSGKRRIIQIHVIQPPGEDLDLLGVGIRIPLFHLPVHGKQIREGERIKQPPGDQHAPDHPGQADQKSQPQVQADLLPPSFGKQHRRRLQREHQEHRRGKLHGHRKYQQQGKERIGHGAFLPGFQRIQPGDQHVKHQQHGEIVSGRRYDLPEQHRQIINRTQPHEIRDPHAPSLSKRQKPAGTLHGHDQRKEALHRVHGLSEKPFHGKQGAERKSSAVIGEPAVQISQPGNHAVFLDPADRLRMVQIRVHMHEAPGCAVCQKERQRGQDQKLRPGQLP